MPHPLTFSRAAPTDIPLIRSLAERIWRASYAAMLAPAQIDHMLAWMYDAPAIAAEMAAGVAWDLAVLDGAGVGYCAIRVDDAGTAMLDKLYLLPTLHGLGHGQAMLTHVAALAQARGCTVLRLRVNKGNDRALRAYERAGFAIVDAVVSEIGGGFVMDDFVLERRLGAAPARPQVKICGLRTPETLDAALDAGAEWVGLVFVPKSPRHVSVEEASGLAAQARGRARIVALTVDAADDALAAIVAGASPDWLQLHGHETPARVAAVKARFGLPVIKAIGVSTDADVSAAAPYDGVADMLLFDAKPPKGAALPGGNGVAFDWTLLRGMAAPFMLSGGLSCETVGDAVRISGAAAVDVSSGVESAPGRKDIAKIRRFVAAARALRPGVNEGCGPQA